MTAASRDLVVLGAGVMGLSVALEEARRGKRVAVVDPSPFGTKASWAAAGILVTRAGLIGGSPFRNFHLRSVPMYPDWLAALEEDSGRAVPYERPGDYQIFVGDPGRDADIRRILDEREDQLRRERASRFERLTEWPEFLKPFGAPGPVRLYRFPDEAAVNNRALLEALVEALRRAGADLRPEAHVVSHQTQGINRLTLRDGSVLEAPRVFIAAGAWCNEPLGRLGFSLPLTAVKGQLAMLPNFHGTRTLLHGGERFYLIPRGDRLIAGATTEPGVWEDGFDEKGETHLGGELSRFFPSVRPEWVETWSGLRPRGKDRLPLLGWLDKNSGIALGTGLYKSGISLAPLASRCLSALLNEEKPPADLRPFDPWRQAAGLATL